MRSAQGERGDPLRVKEAILFHANARYSQPGFQVKGETPLTEHCSILGPEVTEGMAMRSAARTAR